MSKKSFFGLKKAKQAAVTAPVPRKMEEIQAAYVELRGRAGELQYQLHVLRKDLARTNEGLESLNYEASARQKLDKEAAPAPETVPQSVQTPATV